MMDPKSERKQARPIRILERIEVEGARLFSTVFAHFIQDRVHRCVKHESKDVCRQRRARLAFFHVMRSETRTVRMVKVLLMPLPINR